MDKLDPEQVVEDAAPIEVDLDKVDAETPEGDKPDSKPEPKPDTQYVTQDDFKKIQNTLAYQTRQQEKFMKDIKDAVQTPVTPAVTGREPNEIDKVAQNDWQEGVRLVAEKQFEDLRKKEAEESVLKAKEAADMQTMNRNKQYVYEQYKDLWDESTDASKLYTEACNELSGQDANFFGNAYGPIAAMRKMEEKMRADGIPLPGVKEAADKEVERRVRVQGAITPVAKPGKGKNTYTLSNDQRQFCDNNNIPYEQYAKNAAHLEKESSLEA